MVCKGVEGHYKIYKLQFLTYWLIQFYVKQVNVFNGYISIAKMQASDELRFIEKLLHYFLPLNDKIDTR